MKILFLFIMLLIDPVAAMAFSVYYLMSEAEALEAETEAWENKR